jgi:hypothetical protein
MSFRVHGIVVEAESGRPLAAMLVRAYDQDALRDDYLGESRTDAPGRFEVVFTEAHFKDVVETRPDLYLRVFDPSGAMLLLTTAPDVRRNAGHEEFFELRVPRSNVRES